MRIIASIAALAVVVTGIGQMETLAKLSAKTLAPNYPSQGLCRRAPLLAALGPEREQQQTQYPRGGVVKPRHVPVYSIAPPPSVVPPPSAAPPPAPPPPVTVEPDVAGDTEIVTTARRTESRAEDKSAAKSSPSTAESASPIAPPYRPDDLATDDRGYYPYPRPQPQPQSGVLTAGEHDDLLNPELYARYTRNANIGQRIPALPTLDTRRMLTVVVTDSGGQPVPFAQVTLTCADGNSLSFATMADGTVAYFPTLDRLGSEVTISVGRDQGQAAKPRRVLIDTAPGSQRISITSAYRSVPIRKLDLALVVDTTGSMGDEINYVQAELRGIVRALVARHPGIDIRIGLVFYRDEGDDYVTRTFAFDGQVGAVQARIANQHANGGGDEPEAMEKALNRAVQLQWRPDAAKSMVLIADAPPHDELMGQAWAATEAARAKRIHIVPVAASGVSDTAEYVMRGMSALTQSRYLFLTDDSGVGNAHAAPAIDCYLVTRLDGMIRRVLDSQISGRRIEPERQEIIRSVGQYDAGKCVLPRGNWQ